MTHTPYAQNVTIITGASSGIGEALAYELATACDVSQQAGCENLIQETVATYGVGKRFMEDDGLLSTKTLY